MKTSLTPFHFPNPNSSFLIPHSQPGGRGSVVAAGGGSDGPGPSSGIGAGTGGTMGCALRAFSGSNGSVTGGKVGGGTNGGIGGSSGGVAGGCGGDGSFGALLTAGTG